MSLRSRTIENWWPTTQSLDLVEGSTERVAKAVHDEVRRFVKGETLRSSWEAFPDLDAAFRSVKRYTNVPSVFLVLPTRSKWSVLWNNCFLCNGYLSLCVCLTRNHGLRTMHWSAHDRLTSFQAGAHFEHLRLEGGELRKRYVYVGQQERRWHYYEGGEPLPEEDLKGYEARRKRDRLNEERMASLLSSLGATPWQEEFYAIPPARTFVLRRPDLPPTVSDRSVAQVLGRNRQH